MTETETRELESYRTSSSASSASPTVATNNRRILKVIPKKSSSSSSSFPSSSTSGAAGTFKQPPPPPPLTSAAILAASLAYSNSKKTQAEVHKRLSKYAAAGGVKGKQLSPVSVRYPSPEQLHAFNRRLRSTLKEQSAYVNELERQIAYWKSRYEKLQCEYLRGDDEYSSCPPMSGIDSGVTSSRTTTAGATATTAGAEEGGGGAY